MSQRTRVLGDRYELEEMVGRGGMAEVFRATDRVLGRTVAVKVLSDRFAGDRRFVTRFRREAQASAGLNHPNIVSVFDTGSEDGVPYIVMEFVEGKTLADVLAEHGPLPAGRATAIARTVAAALSVAHDRGLVHRDVKPGNIMLTDGDHVRVMDFGIARAAADDTLTQTGTILGTAAYLSPEQAQGMTVGPPSDVYSLGCVLYEMLTGRPPFTGDSAVSVAFRHVRDDPVPLSELGTEAPPELEGVVMRALAKDPEQRFASGGELERALSGPGPTEPVPARPGDTAVLPQGLGEVPAPAGRRWLVPTLLGLLLLVLIVAALVALARQSPEPRGDRRGAATETQPTEEAPQAPTPPTFDEPGSFQEAVSDLNTVLNAGLQAGTITPEAAKDLEKQVEDALKKFVERDREGALEGISEAHAKVDEFLAAGEITDQVWADAVHERLDALAETLQAASLPEEDDDDGPGKSDERGRGNGEGRGRGNDD